MSNVNSVNTSNTIEAAIRQEKILTRHHKSGVKYERVTTEVIANAQDLGTPEVAPPDADKSTQSAQTTVPAATIEPVKKKKEATPSLLWAEHLLSGKMGDWAADHESGYPLTYLWNNIHWELVDESKGRAKAATWLQKAVRTAAKASTAADAWRYSEMLLQAKSPLAKRIGSEVIMPVLNAYLMVMPDTSIKVLKPDKRFGLTYAAQTKVTTPVGACHQPKAVPANSKFGKFLSASLPEADIRALVQEQCALTFMPGPKHMAAWWVGDGRNGKGVLAKLLQKFHFKTACLSLKKLDNEFHLEVLPGASFILIDEVPKGAWCEETFKSLQSGDAVSINRKNKPALSAFSNSAKTIILSNANPFVRDTSNGVHERLCVVRWTAVIPEDQRIDRLEQAIFEEEGHIVLDWLLQGIQRIVKRGRFMPEAERPTAVQSMKKSVRFDNDSVGAWAQDSGATYNPNCKHAKEEIYEAYEKYCQEEGKHILEPQAFWRSVWSMSPFALAKPEEGVRGPSCMFRGAQKRALLIALTREEDALKQISAPKVERNDEFLLALESAFGGPNVH